LGHPVNQKLNKIKVKELALNTGDARPFE